MKNMELTKYKVTALQYSHGEYILGKPVEIIDEGSFYRIDGIHIFDKYAVEREEIIICKSQKHSKEKP